MEKKGRKDPRRKRGVGRRICKLLCTRHLTNFFFLNSPILVPLGFSSQNLVYYFFSRWRYQNWERLNKFSNEHIKNKGRIRILAIDIWLLLHKTSLKHRLTKQICTAIYFYHLPTSLINTIITRKDSVCNASLLLICNRRDWKKIMSIQNILFGDVFYSAWWIKIQLMVVKINKEEIEWDRGPNCSLKCLFHSLF